MTKINNNSQNKKVLSKDTSYTCHILCEICKIYLSSLKPNLFSFQFNLFK